MSINDPFSSAGLNEPGAPEAPGAPGTETTSSVDVLERVEQDKAPGDDERYAHYVRADKITQSAVEGGPVVALCGKVWTPTRNPDKYPVCPTCKEIYKNMRGMNSWPFGPNKPGE